jgi:hypothetical protein
VVHAAGIEAEMELAYAGLHQLCSPLMGGVKALAEPQQRGLSVALGLESREGDGPDGARVGPWTPGRGPGMGQGLLQARAAVRHARVRTSPVGPPA